MFDQRILPVLACAVLGLAATSARADFAGNLGTVTGNAVFGNPAVTVGTASTVAGVSYNFLDQWTFTLASPSNVSSFAAAINFTDALGNTLLSGIGNLQVRLVDLAQTTSVVSWLTVTTPSPNTQQVIALTAPTNLANGSYSLQVRGLLAGSGAYSGALLTGVPTAVPLPATLPLLLAGAAALGLTGRRRQA